MAKTSIVARNEKRKRLVAKYAAKREELKAAGISKHCRNYPATGPRLAFAVVLL